VGYIVPTTQPASNLRLQVRATGRIPYHAEPVRFVQGTLLIPCHAERVRIVPGTLLNPSHAEPVRFAQGKLREASPQFLPTPTRSILHANCRAPSSSRSDRDSSQDDKHVARPLLTCISARLRW
jgi:hypothetical protein